MNYKIEGAIRKNRKSFINCAILWLLLVIVFVAPFSYSVFESSINGQFSLEIFMDKIATNIMNPFGTLGGIFSRSEAIHDFISLLLGFSIFYLIMFFVGFAKSAPKNEFSDIEHGSSDWANGEEYSVLSKNKGILLAEKHYLPVDKRGNVNVLVVGRFWFW